jgi:hypothetical protein
MWVDYAHEKDDYMTFTSELPLLDILMHYLPIKETLSNNDVEKLKETLDS